MDSTNPSAVVKLARVAAVALAIGVVGYLVWRAQAGARGAETPAPQVAPPELLQQPSSPVDERETLDLSTTMSLAPDLPLQPPPDSGPDVLLPSSKFAPLRLAPTPENELLFSSKSGRPIAPDPIDN